MEKTTGADEFWVTLAVYVVHASLYSIKWAEKFGQKDIDGMVKRCKMAFDESGAIGHFIMWYLHGDNRILRFGWVIVDDSKRGMGYGKEITEEDYHKK